MPHKDPAAAAEIAACPFCGSREIDPEGWWSHTSHGPACDDCGASAGSSNNTPEQNLAAWNRRTIPAGWTLVPPGEEGKVTVPTEALRWLMGMGESFDRPDGERGAFWWRTEFLRRAGLNLFDDIAAPPSAAAKES